MITMMIIIMIIIIVMVIMMINNNQNANDDDGDQTITIFQTIHFRKPVISAKPKFSALARVLVYDYWCCQLTILSAYNASVKFLLRYYQYIVML